MFLGIGINVSVLKVSKRRVGWDKFEDNIICFFWFRYNIKVRNVILYKNLEKKKNLEFCFCKEYL